METYEFKKISMYRLRNLNLVLVTAILFMGCSHNEVMRIKNTASNENIYMKYYSEWDNMLVISTNRNLKPDTSINFMAKYTTAYFYKLNNDTLTIYGGYHHSGLKLLEKFKTVIIYKEVVNYEFIELCETYESKGLTIFPESWIPYARNYKK